MSVHGTAREEAPPRRRRNSGEETQARLLDAARRLGATMPYSQITVEHVTEEVGISRATFYLYFKNKSDIYLRLAEHTAEALYEAAGRTWRAADVRSSIERATRGYIEAFLAHIGALRVLYTLSFTDERFGELLRGSRRRFLDRIERNLRVGQEQGLFRPIDPTFASHALGGMVESFCVRELLLDREDGGDPEHPDVDVDRAVSTLSDLWYHAVASAPDD